MVGLVSAAGTQTKTYAYDAFGNEKDRVGSDPNPFRYCGEYFDVESGAYYLRARYYDLSVGRFTQEDTAKDGLNWYSYTGGNPVLFIDPTGMFRIIDDAYCDSYEYQDGMIAGTDYISNDIRLLQLRLQELGFLPEDFCNYGFFDRQTYKAVNAYKEAVGLYNEGDAHGVVGPTTWAHLKLPFDSFESYSKTYSVVYIEKGVIRIDATKGTIAKEPSLKELHDIAAQAKIVYKIVMGEEIAISTTSLYAEILYHVYPNIVATILARKKLTKWIANSIKNRTNMIDCGDDIICPDGNRAIWDYLAGDINFATFIMKIIKG